MFNESQCGQKTKLVMGIAATICQAFHTVISWTLPVSSAQPGVCSATPSAARQAVVATSAVVSFYLTQCSNKSHTFSTGLRSRIQAGQAILVTPHLLWKVVHKANSVRSGIVVLQHCLGSNLAK